MSDLLDPKTRRNFLLKRKENNKIRANSKVEKELYTKLSEKSGLTPAVLKNAAYGRDENAFMNVASNDSLSNHDKELILSGAVGKFNKEVSSTSRPTFEFTKKWKTPVRERDSVCSPITGWCNHKKVTVLGGGQRNREHISKAKAADVDFSNIDSNTSYSDIFTQKIKAPITGIEVAPVEAINYLSVFKS